LLFIVGSLLTGYRVHGEEDAYEVLRKRRTVVIQEVEYLVGVPPKNLCPFTVDIYPEILHAGDPLYVRINFHNTTNLDAYAIVFGGYAMDKGHVEFYLREDRDSRLVRWHTYNGFNDAALRSVTNWQKVEPGQKGPTVYIPLGFPESGYGRIAFPLDPSVYDGQRWREIKGLTQERIEEIEEVRSKIFAQFGAMLWEEIDNETSAKILNAVKIVQPGASGQLMVLVNNRGIGRNYGFIDNEADRHMLMNQRMSFVVDSAPILIKPRSHKEMELLGGWDRGFPSRQDLERIISELTPGTLKNLLKCEILLFDWIDCVVYKEVDGEWQVQILETQALETLKKIEDFLKTLHDIERDVLKSVFYGGDPLTGEGNMSFFYECGSEKVRQRIAEVFGERTDSAELWRQLWQHGSVWGGGM